MATYRPRIELLVQNEKPVGFSQIIMASTAVADIPRGGFSFENCRRNEVLASKGFPAPKFVKTGTTIAGLIYKDGVILGADTRATEGNIVADKNCMKLHYMAPNIYCAGAGTAADLEMTTLQMSSQLELHRLNTGRTVRVATANRLLKQMLFKYQGYISAALVLGGIDNTGPHIYCIYPHGSTDKLPYTAMGSGSLAAMAVLEAGWKPDLELEDAKRLMRNAIAAGVFNDLMSGSHVDLCIITREKAEIIRPYDIANVKGERQGSYRYARGSSAVLSTRVIPIEVETTEVRRVESMDTA